MSSCNAPHATLLPTKLVGRIIVGALRDDTKNGCVADYLRSEYLAIHTAPKCGTELILNVMLHFRDRRSAASLRYRNRAEITVLYMCEQKPDPVWFSCRCKSSLRASSPIWASEANLARTRERRAAPRSRVLVRLASLAQIGELACRLVQELSDELA